MNSYLSKRGYVIRKDSISQDILIELKTTLIGRPLIDDKYNFKSSTFPLYTETKNKIYIPKVYALQKYGPTKELVNYIGTKWDNDLEFNGELRDYQKDACDVLLKSLFGPTNSGILSLGTGFGKTYCCLYVLSQLKGKTLVIVNKISLMKQWESEISKCLPHSTIGFIQGQKKIDIAGKHIVIAMLQSLAKIDYPDECFQDFNVCVIDEIHNISSPIFSKVLMKTSSKYTIGLSATPTRSDGCEYVFKWFIGDIVYQSKNSSRQGLSPLIHTVKIKSSDYKEILNNQNKLMFTSMVTNLVNIEKRNKLIIELVKHLVHSDDRRILVLSDRREHVKNLKSIIDNDATITFTSGIFIGQMKIEDLERSKSCQVIFATYSSFGEGVNEKDLNTLIMTTPKKFIGHLTNKTKQESGKLEQYIGRIFRKSHTITSPLIIDLQDEFSVYRAQTKQRMVFYKEHFDVVQFINSIIDLDSFDLSNLNYNSLTTKINPVSITTTTIYDTCLLD
jgi:superfamily II DNA or RNA helicase